MSAERLYTSEVARRLLDIQAQPRHVNVKPSFRVSQVKGPGGQTVIEWDVQVPVCDEYPSAGEAFNASLLYAQAYCDRFPNSNGGGE